MSRGLGFSFRPAFEGELSVPRVPEDFFTRLEHRVASGLFELGSRGRSRYRVVSSSPDGLTFEAEDSLTAYGVGLNQVELRRTSSGMISYRVRFDRWWRYAILHGALIGMLGVLLYIAVPAVSRDVHAFSYGPRLYWGVVAFWSLCWPWILIAGHRPFARKALEHTLLQEMAADPRVRAAA